MPRTCEQCGNPVNNHENCQVCMLQLGISQAKPEPPQYAGNLPSIAELNTQFPQLDITRLIGRGGMGAIYHARQTALDRDVALKLIAREVAGDSAFIERFEREAKALAKLSHPNIVTIFDFGRTSDGQAYLMMEYVDGINLREAMISKSVGAEDALDIISTICRALEYAHSKGVVHRDIKPENILLGEDGTLKVADFGIAKIIDDSVRSPTLTATRQVLGSLHYLAPEHLEAPSEVDHRVDLYALGVVFYELLTGQLPLGRFEPPSLLHAKSDQKKFDGRIDAIVMKTLNRRPKQRYQSAKELATEIQKIETGPPPHDLPLAEVVDAPRAISVPFSCSAMGGLAEVVGILHAKNQNLVAEFRVRDAFFRNVKSGMHTVKMPIGQLASVDLKTGLFNSSIVIAAETMTVLANLPNAESGRVELNIKRGDLARARNVLDAIGFNRRPHASPQPLVAQATPLTDNGHWVTYAVLMIFCSILNFGLLAAVAAAASSEFGAREAAPAVIASTVLFAPVAILQILTGVACLAFRLHGLARATAIVSMLPIAPGFIISAPIGIWAYRWLRDAKDEADAATTSNPTRHTASTNHWGATTLMYIRESRWSKLIASLNLAGLALALAALGLYKAGVFSTDLKFRIVNTTADSTELNDAIEARIGNLGTVLLNADGASANNAHVIIRTHGSLSERRQIQQALEVESHVEIVWLAQTSVSKNSEEDNASGSPTLASSAVLKPIPVASKLEFDSETATLETPLGKATMPLAEPLTLKPSYVSKIAEGNYEIGRSLTYASIEIEWSTEGREVLTALLPEGVNSVGLGLIIDGVVEGFASQNSIAGKRVVFELAESSSISPAAIIAAVRGPVIPSDLEFREDN